MVNNLVKAIGWSILHSLWQGAIIYALLFLVLMVWPKMSARIKHNLAFGSLFLIFASFCFTFGSIFEWPSSSPAVKNIVITPDIYQRLTGLATSINAKTEAYFPIVVVVYIIGIIFQLAVLSSSYLKLKKLKQAHVNVVPEAWKAIFEQTLAQLKIKKTVQFYLSSRVNVPLIIGFFKPVVLFPIALATQLDSQQVEAILIHELSHIRRNDYLINLAKTFIETLLFFNPFVWLTTKFIHIEREHACDDLVVNFTGSPITYAHALLKLELLKDKHSPSLALAATGNNQHLYQRIKRITAMKTNYINVKQQFFILTLAIATVVSLAWMNPSKSAAKAKKAQSLVTVQVDAREAKSLSTHLTVCADTDTVKSKRKTKMIITVDENGKRKEYHSIKDLPDSLRQQIYINGVMADSTFAYFKSPAWKKQQEEIRKSSEELRKKFSSPEWKKQQEELRKTSEEMRKKFDSPEWKSQMEAVRKQSEEMRKKFSSPEWKKQQEELFKHSEETRKLFNSQEWKDQMLATRKQSEDMIKLFNSPEWKKQQEDLRKNSEELRKKFNSPEWKSQMESIKKQSEEMKKKFNSPEWKEKIEQLKQLQDSPEYKELRKKYESDLEELKKKKGIKSDKAFLLFDTNMDVAKTFLPNVKAFDTYFAYTTPQPIVIDTKNNFNFEIAPIKLDNTFKMEGTIKIDNKKDNK